MLVADFFVAKIASSSAPECYPPRHTRNHLKMWKRVETTPSPQGQTAQGYLKRKNRTGGHGQTELTAELRSVAWVASFQPTGQIR